MVNECIFLLWWRRWFNISCWMMFISINLLFHSTSFPTDYGKHLQISHTFYPKIFVSNQGCSLSVRRKCHKFASSDTIHQKFCAVNYQELHKNIQRCTFIISFTRLVAPWKNVFVYKYMIIFLAVEWLCNQFKVAFHE